MIQQALVLLADQEDQMFPFFFFAFGVPLLIIGAIFLIGCAVFENTRSPALKRLVDTFTVVGCLVGTLSYMFFALGPLLEWSGVN